MLGQMPVDLGMELMRRAVDVCGCGRNGAESLGKRRDIPNRLQHMTVPRQAGGLNHRAIATSVFKFDSQFSARVRRTPHHEPLEGGGSTPHPVFRSGQPSPPESRLTPAHYTVRPSLLVVAGCESSLPWCGVSTSSQALALGLRGSCKQALCCAQAASAHLGTARRLARPLARPHPRRLGLTSILSFAA